MNDYIERLRETIPEPKRFEQFMERVNANPHLKKYIEETGYDDTEILEEYYSSYPASPPYKNEVLRPFLVKWYLNLGGKNPESDLPEYCYKDKTTELLKLLHNRKGVTKSELAEALGESERRVQTDLRLLSPSLGKEREGNNKKLSIGGNVVEVEISQKRRDSQKVFYTPNTIHPLVLLPNLMQIVNILTALSRLEMGTDESQVAIYNGMNIWLQLSDYCKEIIKAKFTPYDTRLNDYIVEIESEIVGIKEYSYITERAMSEEYGNIAEQLMIAYKENKLCNIELIAGYRMYEQVHVKMIASQKNNVFKNVFELFSDDESIKNVVFTADECNNVEFL